VTSSYHECLLNGRRAMAHLIHVWHEQNSWSHKVLPALAETLDLGKIHNSQISNLRNGKLSSTGPEVFFTLSQVNGLLHHGIDTVKDQLITSHPELLKVLVESSNPLLGDDGKPLGAGQLVEIFVGLSPLPLAFDWFIEEEEASSISAALADVFCNGMSWRNCREKVMNAYPVVKANRRERFAEVMAGLRDYTAEELDGELFDLYATKVALTGLSMQGAEKFLIDLRKRSNKLNT